MILRPLLHIINHTSLVAQIALGLLAGILLAWFWPEATASVGFLGNLFISALKAVAPVLVFILVASAIANHSPGQPTHIRPILLLYLIGTLAAAVVAVVASSLWPYTLVLAESAQNASPPGGIAEVLKTLALNVVDNPVNALLKANFVGILAWAIGIGLAIRHGSDSTRAVFHDLAQGVTLIVRAVIRCTPLGVFGLVATTFADAGLKALLGYVHLLAVLLG